jgi:hypothetical protein
VAAAFGDMDSNPGRLYVSSDSGATWTPASAPSSRWFSVTSSADGSQLAAVSSTGAIFTSANGGQDWSSNDVPALSWFAVTSSADGMKLAALAGGDNPGPIYTSNDGGKVWEASESMRDHWTSAAFSADAGQLVAVAGGYSPGAIYAWRSPLPKLRLVVSGADLVVCWPTNASRFFLQQTADPLSSEWVAVKRPLSTIGRENQVVIPQASGRGFFRLKSL